MLIPLQITIGQKKDGSAKYPDFSEVMKHVDPSVNWCHYVDQFGGWHYDCCGHQDHEEHSPVGQQVGMLLVPSEFADKACELFPDTCSVLTEKEAADFYDNHVCKNDPETVEDLEELQVIAALEALGEDVTERKRNALDPEHPARGRRRNKRKTWTGYKQMRAVEIDHESIGVLSKRQREHSQARRDGNAPDAGEPTGA